MLVCASLQKDENSVLKDLLENKIAVSIGHVTALTQSKMADCISECVKNGISAPEKLIDFVENYESEPMTFKK